MEGDNIRYAHLEGADLRDAHLERADLRNARSQEVRLRRAQLQEADLTRAHFGGAILRWAHLDAAHLRYIYLEGADLRDAHLERSDLRNAHLQEARLQHAQLEEADLTRANLEGANLHETEFSYNTKFVRVYWGDYIIGEERKQQFLRATDIYRRLKMWYTNVGIYDIAGEFFFREMTAKRKNFWRQGSQKKPFRELFHPFKPKELSRAIFPRKPFHWAWSKLLSVLCGYGERPLRVVVLTAAIIFGLAAAYYFWGSFTSSSFWDTLYYSAASFTALGYGNWASQPTGWAKGRGAAEAIIGVFMIALFLITFTRKWTR